MKIRLAVVKKNDNNVKEGAYLNQDLASKRARELQDKYPNDKITCRWVTFDDVEWIKIQNTLTFEQQFYGYKKGNLYVKGILASGDCQSYWDDAVRTKTLDEYFVKNIVFSDGRKQRLG